MSTTGNPLTSNAEASYQRELTRANLFYLSELDDYSRTVLTLRSRVKACEAEHGTRNDYDKV